MTPTTTSRSTGLTAASAIAAAIAALALTACGPHDNTDPSTLAGGAAAATQPAVTGSAVPQATLPAIAASDDRVGVPVPPMPSVAQAPMDPASPRAMRDAPPPVYAPSPERRVADARPADRNTMGRVESIQPIRERPQGSGAGAVIGGVLGAVVGNQFGHSAGRAAMTGLGAVGGAVAGNNIERNHREGITGYRVSIRLDNGNTRTYERNDVGNLQVGDRVHLDPNSFHRV